jgi:colanic acid biosynthesis glycosyl transferase WcaI
MMKGLRRGADVVVVNQYFPPDTSATALRLSEVCQRLSRDWGVTVLCGTPSYNPDRESSALQNGTQEFRIVRIPSCRFSRRTRLGRGLNYATYLLGVTIALAFVPTKRCIVAFTDPPIVGLPALLWARLKRKPLIQVVQDLHPEAAVASGLLRDGVLAATFRWITNLYLRRAHAVVVIGERMKAHLISARNVAEQRITLIPNWSEIDEVISKGDVTAADSPVFKVLYAGNLGLSQGLDIIIACAERLRRHGDIQFLVVGDGVEREAFVKAVGERKLTNVSVLGERLPKAEFAQLIAGCQIGLVLMKDGFNSAIVPSKVYTIMAAGIPFLSAAAAGSEIEALALRHGAGIVIGHDAEEMAAAILRLRDQPDDRKRMGENGRFAIIRDYSRDASLGKYAALVKEVCSPRK